MKLKLGRNRYVKLREGVSYDLIPDLHGGLEDSVGQTLPPNLWFAHLAYRVQYSLWGGRLLSAVQYSICKADR